MYILYNNGSVAAYWRNDCVFSYCGDNICDIRGDEVG